MPLSGLSSFWCFRQDPMNSRPREKPSGLVAGTLFTAVRELDERTPHAVTEDRRVFGMAVRFVSVAGCGGPVPPPAQESVPASQRPLFCEPPSP